MNDARMNVSLSGGCAGGKGPAATLRIGVVSDLHITDWKSTEIFRKALRWYRDQAVDAVMVVGDLTDHGLLPQLENVARAWREAFPDDCAPDGRHVEKLFLYGNHDLEGLWYRDRWMDAAFAVHGITREEACGLQLKKIGLAKAWEQCFGEPYAPIYRKRVKGYDFIGAHWDSWTKSPAGIEEWFRANAGTIDADRPFFYFQHSHLKDTVYGPWACGHDDGATTRALSPYTNAVAFSGHSHMMLTDERSVWRGSFTSIGTASLSYGFFEGSRENASGASWTGPKQMPNLNDIIRAAAIGEEGGVPIAQGMLVDVFDDRMEIQRRDFVRDEDIDEPWHLELPTREMPFSALAAQSEAPEFPDGAKVAVSFGHGRDRTGTETDQVTVAFPPAGGKTTRPFDYEIVLEAREGDAAGVVASWRFYSPTAALPKRFDAEGKPSFTLARSVLPEKARFRFIARPLNSYGTSGKPLFSEWLAKPNE